MSGYLGALGPKGHVDYRGCRLLVVVGDLRCRLIGRAGAGARVSLKRTLESVDGPVGKGKGIVGKAVGRRGSDDLRRGQAAGWT